MKALGYIIDSIQNGYILLLPQYQKTMGFNYKSALEQKRFVTSVVLDLLATGCILKVDKRPFIGRFLSVVEGSSKKRLMVNLRHLNRFLWKQSLSIILACSFIVV